ncbi:MAG TPA: hypothetical protein HPP56_04075 [Nitrospirae bacterium]|nr:hypothetical protein [Nitrospirota bacterium]
MTKPPIGTFFIRCRIKIPHQPFLSYLLILVSFLVLSPILGGNPILNFFILFVTIIAVVERWPSRSKAAAC